MPVLSGVKSELPPSPQKASGSHFYRYSEFAGEKRKWLREIILEHRLYVPKLKQLNDPADGRPRLARKSESELYLFLYSSPYGILGRNPRMTVEHQVREAVILDVNMRRHGAEVLQRELAKCLNARLEDYRIYSLSKRYDNLSLWAKYAGNHSGYCLEFANEGPFFDCAKEVIYGDSVQMDINNPDHLNGYWFFCKSREWSNEEEVRILVPRQSEDKVQTDPCCLTRVILGWKMLEEGRAQIREWAKQRQPRLTVMSAYYDELDHVIRLRPEEL